MNKKISTDDVTKMTGQGQEILGTAIGTKFVPPYACTPYSFLGDLNKFHPYIKFNHDRNKESVHFLDLKVRFSNGKI